MKKLLKKYLCALFASFYMVTVFIVPVEASFSDLYAEQDSGYLYPEWDNDYLYPERNTDYLYHERYTDYLYPERNTSYLYPERNIDYMYPELVTEQLYSEDVTDLLHPEVVTESLSREEQTEFLFQEEVNESLYPERVANSLYPERVTGGLYPEVVTESLYSERLDGHKYEDVPVFYYQDSEYGDGYLDRLDDQFHYLHDAGYDTISLADYDRYYRGEYDLPERPLLLTFGDGYGDYYNRIDPLLDRYGYNAIGFVDPNLVEARYNDGWRNMVQSNRWEIAAGAYSDRRIVVDEMGTMGDFFTNRIYFTDQRRIETENEYQYRIENYLSHSRSSIERITGRQSLGFAYPYGGDESYNYDGYSTIFTNLVHQNFPLFFECGSPYSSDYNFGDNQIIGMNKVSYSLSREQISSQLSYGHSNVVPVNYGDRSYPDQGWIKDRGALNCDGERMTVSSDYDETSGSVFYNGSDRWNNYSMQMHGDWNEGSNFGIFPYYKDSSNYLMAEFSENKTTLYSMDHGNRHIVQESPYGVEKNKEFGLSLGINDFNLGLYIGEQEVINTPIPDDYLGGEVGFATWGPQYDGAEFEINDIQFSDIGYY